MAKGNRLIQVICLVPVIAAATIMFACHFFHYTANHRVFPHSDDLYFFLRDMLINVTPWVISLTVQLIVIHKHSIGLNCLRAVAFAVACLSINCSWPVMLAWWRYAYVPSGEGVPSGDFVELVEIVLSYPLCLLSLAVLFIRWLSGEQDWKP